MGGRSNQDSYSAGLGYQLPALPMLKGAMAELQYDHIDVDGTFGMPNQVQAASFDGTVDMVSLSFDMLF